MDLFEYALVALAALAIAGRLAMFLPRSPKRLHKAA